MNKRKFRRIPLTSFKDIDLLLNNKHYQNIQIKDLSLSGLYIEGLFTDKLGDECELLLKTSEEQPNTYLKLPCKIIRVKTKGIALEFSYPNQDCLVYLETLILYHAEDPFAAATEFPDESTKKP